MSAPKKVSRAPTARDTRLREAMSALLVHGSARKASAATGIPYRTIGTWAASTEGKAILAELAATVGADRAAKIWEVADAILERLKANVDKLPVQALAVNYGILADKARALAQKADQNDAGDLQVVVKFGGVRVRDEESGRMTEGAAAEVFVRRSTPGA